MKAKCFVLRSNTAMPGVMYVNLYTDIDVVTIYFTNMKRSKSKYNADMAGNQVVFRGRNEKVRKNIDEFNETAEELGEELIDTRGKEYLLFYCECSDEKCLARIKVTFATYKKTHEERDTFMVKPNHVVSDIEAVTQKTSEYWVVKKYDDPSQSATELRVSGLNHS